MIILQEENGRLSAMHSEGRSHPLQLFGRWVLLWQLQDEEAMRLPADINEVISPTTDIANNLFFHP